MIAFRRIGCHWAKKFQESRKLLLYNPQNFCSPAELLQPAELICSKTLSFRLSVVKFAGCCTENSRSFFSNFSFLEFLLDIWSLKHFRSRIQENSSGNSSCPLVIERSGVEGQKIGVEERDRLSRISANRTARKGNCERWDLDAGAPKGAKIESCKPSGSFGTKTRSRGIHRKWEDPPIDPKHPYLVDTSICSDLGFPMLKFGCPNSRNSRNNYIRINHSESEIGTKFWQNFGPNLSKNAVHLKDLGSRKFLFLEKWTQN